MRHFLLVACLAGAWIAAGCAKPPAVIELPMPELAPPPAPPRVVAVAEPEVIEVPAPAPPEPATEVAAAPPRPRPARPRPAPDAEPVLKAEDVPPPAPAPQGAGLTLKPPAGSSDATEAAIRTLLSRAGRLLSQVAYGALDRDGRTQFDTARRFIEQADEALQAGNVVFASKLADKAASMASILQR